MHRPDPVMIAAGKDVCPQDIPGMNVRNGMHLPVHPLFGSGLTDLLRDVNVKLRVLPDRGKIDGTVYTVNIHFKADAKESVRDKIMRLIRKDVEA